LRLWLRQVKWYGSGSTTLIEILNISYICVNFSMRCAWFIDWREEEKNAGKILDLAKRREICRAASDQAARHKVNWLLYTVQFTCKFMRVHAHVLTNIANVCSISCILYTVWFGRVNEISGGERNSVLTLIRWDFPSRSLPLHTHPAKNR
jgi:hypothetical protein